MTAPQGPTAASEEHSPSSAPPHPLAAARYASLTTFRRTGVAVSTPVWIAGTVDGSGRLAVITVDDTGKTKRLGHTDRVELRACDVRGRVAPGTPTYTGTARVVRDAEHIAEVRAAVVAKYGLPARFSDLAERVTSLVGLRRKPRAGIVIEAETHPRPKTQLQPGSDEEPTQREPGADAESDQSEA